MKEFNLITPTIPSKFISILPIILIVPDFIPPNLIGYSLISMPSIDCLLIFQDLLFCSPTPLIS